MSWVGLDAKINGGNLVPSIDISTTGDIQGDDFTGTGDHLFTGDGSGIPYAGIYVKESAATISVDSDLGAVLVTQWTTNTPSNNCTPDQANNKITITKAGVYYVDFHVTSSLNGGATVVIEYDGYLDGVSQDCLHCHRTISSTDRGSQSFASYIDVTSVPVDLDVRADQSSTVARNLTVEDAQFNVRQVGGT